MRIAEFLSPEAVVASLSARSKPDVLRELSAALARAHPPLLEERLVGVLRDGTELSGHLRELSDSLRANAELLLREAARVLRPGARSPSVTSWPTPTQRCSRSLRTP